MWPKVGRFGSSKVNKYNIQHTSLCKWHGAISRSWIVENWRFHGLIILLNALLFYHTSLPIALKPFKNSSGRYMIRLGGAGILPILPTEPIACSQSSQTWFLPKTSFYWINKFGVQTEIVWLSPCFKLCKIPYCWQISQELHVHSVVRPCYILFRWRNIHYSGSIDAFE